MNGKHGPPRPRPEPLPRPKGDGDALTASLNRVAKAIEAGTIRPLACPEGTCIVFRFPGQLSSDERNRLRKTLESMFPGRQVAVLDDGAELSVMDLAAAKQGEADRQKLEAAMEVPGEDEEHTEWWVCNECTNPCRIPVELIDGKVPDYITNNDRGTCWEDIEPAWDREKPPPEE